MSRISLTVLLSLAALLILPLSASAAPTLSAETGDKANSYVISGAGFEPGSVVDVIEVPCAEMPCHGDGGPRVSDVVVDENGAFSVVLQSFEVKPGDRNHDYRLVMALEKETIASEDTPHIQVRPLNHPGKQSTPGVPTVGTGLATPGSANVLPWLVGAGVAFALAGFGLRQDTRRS